VARGANLAAIFRKGEVIVPHGADAILPGDRIVVVGDDESIHDIQRCSTSRIGRAERRSPSRRS